MAPSSPTATTPRLVWLCQSCLHPLLCLAALACLLALIGWLGSLTPTLHALTLTLCLGFALERFIVFRFCQTTRQNHRRLMGHALLGAALTLLALSLAFLPPSSPPTTTLTHVIALAAISLAGLSSLIHHQTRYTARAFHPSLILLGSFAFIIAIGTLLLKMPLCCQPGNACSWLDAAFTSTSAVCVTGLTVHDTSQFFSLTGQSIILILIQIGGFGIMTLTFFAAVVLFEGLSLHDRLLLGKMIQENRLARITKTLTFIVAMTLTCEAIGTLILFLSLDAIPDPSLRLFHSLFHSVSAFCNAGFSSLPNNLACSAITHPTIWQSVIMTLIVIGGLGALTNEDLSLWCRSSIKRWSNPTLPRHRLRVHTRLVLSITAFLILAGASAILISEFVLSNGPQHGGVILTSLFHSITARTAGFNTVPMSQISPLTSLILMALMFIGGSPGGTAGGLRTTVFAVGLAHLWNLIRSSKRGLIVFNRTIPPQQGADALALASLTFIWLSLNYFILLSIQPHSQLPQSHLLFELISAFATVGLSLDLTPTLSNPAKTLLILNMFVGRIGLMTALSALTPPDLRPPSGKPHEPIVLS